MTKAFAPPFFNRFRLSLKRKKPCGNEIHKKETTEAVSRSQIFFKLGVLKNFASFTGKHLCWSQLYLEETPKQLLSCEICEIFKNPFFYRTPPVAVSETKMNSFNCRFITYYRQF